MPKKSAAHFLLCRRKKGSKRIIGKLLKKEDVRITDRQKPMPDYFTQGSILSENIF